MTSPIRYTSSIQRTIVPTDRQFSPPSANCAVVEPRYQPDITSLLRAYSHHPRRVRDWPWLLLIAWCRK